MANTKSAKKMVRKIERRTEVNRIRRGKMRTYVRKVEDALAAGDKVTAEAAMKKAEPQLAKAAQNGIIHRNAASRKVSRLVARLRAL